MGEGYKYRKACFGGTFDLPTHKGHEALIKKAFEVAKFCYIGMTGDNYGWMCKKPKSSFQERKKNMENFLKSHKIGKNRYRVSELDKFFGSEAIDQKKGIEAIVVSERTMPGARGINVIREELGLKPLDVVMIKMVKGNDNEPISSRRIRVNEIDEKGNVIKDA